MPDQLGIRASDTDMAHLIVLLHMYHTFYGYFVFVHVHARRCHVREAIFNFLVLLQLDRRLAYIRETTPLRTSCSHAHHTLYTSTDRLAAGRYQLLTACRLATLSLSPAHTTYTRLSTMPYM